ncbi:MAG: creatininase family protein [Bacteroidota bacterium]|jgi:creatinine amidohydrolase|nr:creatininase family protein [Bacteroidota bacterium]
MKKIHCTLYILICLFTLFTQKIIAQTLPTHWEELTASDWDKALQASNRTCILPIGILEKHGPHVPIGSDLIRVRAYAELATKKEYAVVFPEYYFGQINEAKHQPGVFALQERVVWDMLEATCNEIARNGFKKIIIINGHGGNPELIRYFIQTRLEQPHDYAVYFFEPHSDSSFLKELKALHQSPINEDMHAGENETSELLYLRPDLVKMDSAKNESGKNLSRWHIPNVYTAIWWYADFPNHYAGEGNKATPALGKLLVQHVVNQLTNAIKDIKADNTTIPLQNEFYNRVRK